MTTSVYFLLLTASFLQPPIVFAQKEYYIPKALIIPFHDQKNQLHVSAGRGGGYDINLSYSISNHFAVFTAGVLDKDTKKRRSLFGDRLNIQKDDHVAKAGFGYFFKVNKRLYNIIETYAGIGFYKVENYRYFIDSRVGDSTIANFWNIFWQINICRKEKKQELAFALRFAYSRYDSINFFSTDWNVRYPTSSYKNLGGISADPAISYSYKLYKFKFNVQCGLSLPLFWVKATKVDRDFNQSVRTYKQQVAPAAILGRLSIQYGLSLAR